MGSLIFLYVLYLFINNYYLILLVSVNPQAIPLESGATITPKPVTDDVLKIEVLAVFRKASTVFN